MKIEKENKMKNRLESPVRKGDVIEQFGNQYTIDDLESLEELLNLWENVVYEGRFEELYSLVSQLYDLEEEMN